MYIYLYKDVDCPYCGKETTIEWQDYDKVSPVEAVVTCSSDNCMKKFVILGRIDLVIDRVATIELLSCV